MTESVTQPTRSQIRKWRQYLANERAEAATYRELAKKREGCLLYTSDAADE